MRLERHYSVGEAARILGVSVKTIQRWDREGRIRCVRTVGGKRRIPESEIRRILGLGDGGKIVGYARVSSRSQKDDLERQAETIRAYARSRGWSVEILKDIGSGVNPNRRGFKKLLRMVIEGEVSKIIVTYPDRLTRFSFETLEELFRGYGVEVIAIERGTRTPREELVEDLISVISHFAGRLYGRRSHKYRRVVEGAKKLLRDP